MQILLSLSVAILAGLLMTRLAKPLGLPSVTAYLVAGVLIGPFCLGRLGIEGLGFAIPIDTAKPILEKLMAGGGDDLSGQGSYGGSDATQTFPQGGRQRIY